MYRIGQSIDIHRLVPNRDLILGGVKIPFKLGLLGHSDADVLLHAVMEAIIGALGLGDIGKFFPDTDEKYKNIDSRILTNEVYKIMDKRGYEVNNLDCLLIMEQPKMRPYIDSIRESIASLLHTSVDNINVKATTNEKLGEIGRLEAIQAHAIIMLRKKEDLCQK